MAVVSLIAAALAPGLALLSYFYLKDRYHSEPIRVVGKMFAIGFLVVFPVMILQRGLGMALGSNPYLFTFVETGMVEEFFKWFIICFFIYTHAEFDEPYDGIVYAVAVALGFATFENVMLAVDGHTTVGTLLVRAVLPVSGHALFGVIMGYYFGRAKFSADKRGLYLFLALFYPILWHGVFDSILLNAGSRRIWLIVPFMAVLWALSLHRVKKANSASPLARVPSADASADTAYFLAKKGSLRTRGSRG